MDTAAPPTSISERAEALEKQLSDELDRQAIPVRSTLYTSGERDPRRGPEVVSADPQYKDRTFNMGPDPRLAPMPDKPTLLDFFELRMGPAMHLLQSATHALRNGCNEKIILACLLHDIAVTMFIRSDHGYWGSALIAPYVDEEVAWAVKAHQALRFYPDKEYGYEYPQLYIKFFGDAYTPEPYIQREYERARKHKWYETARLITVNDIYSFDPTMSVSMDPFRDIIARNFRQPEEGLGWDDSPSSHMWRTINWPTRFL
jgi:hypothetical protein